ncbi:MAG: PAS domain S-box protein [Desulfobacterales bacterium]|jgi:PAS domain S-box-containing protein|nr:PAS domain S-box protein [Desulfobacterales bacterium]
MKKAAISTERIFLLSFLVVAVLLTGYSIHLYGLMQFHLYAALFQAIISFCVFALAWNARKIAENSFLCFFGTAFFFIGVLDLSQLVCLKANPSLKIAIDTASLLPFKSMSAVEERMINHAAQLWILARYLESLSFAASFLFFRRKATVTACFTLYAGITGFCLLAIFDWQLFPNCFTAVAGFTPFKHISHLIIAFIFLATLFILSRHQGFMEPKMSRLLAAALVLAALAEFGYSWNILYYHYTRPPAQILKCVGFFLIYKAIITTGFSNPIELLFRNLKDSQASLARERDKLFSILDILPGLIFVQTQAHAITYANKRFTDMFGEVNNRHCNEIFLNCHSSCDNCPATRVLETKTPVAFEWKSPDGKTFILHYGYFHDTDGAPHVLASGIDITDRVAARTSLEDTKERYRTLYEHTPVMLHSVDKTGKLLNVSYHWLKMLGYEKEEIIGRDFVDFLTPESRTEWEAVSLPKLLRNGSCKDVLFQLLKKDGSLMDIELSIYAEKDAYGKMKRSLAVSIDITDKLKAQRALQSTHEQLEQRVFERTEALKQKTLALEQQIQERIAIGEALRASEQKYSLLVENSLTGIYIKLDGKIIFANDRFCKIHGYTHEEVIGMDSWRLVYPYDRAMVDAYSRKQLEKDAVPADYEARGLTKSGDVIWVTRNSARIIYRDKPALLGNLADITLRKKMEAELKNSEKELKLLSARLLNAQENERKRIAIELHDTIAQNLVTIKFTLGQKLKQMNSPTPTQGVKIEDLIEIVQQNISEVRRIMTDLRPSILDDLGILATISWHCREFQNIYSQINIHRNIDLEEQDVPQELKIVIFRILQESMSNAAKHSHATRIDLNLIRQNGDLELAIRDNGHGFDFRDVLSRVNSSKGLGLIGMRERSEQSFGLFSIQSKMSEGTLIRVRWRVGPDGVVVSWKEAPDTPDTAYRLI